MSKSWIGAAAVLAAIVGAIYVVREAAQTSPATDTAEPSALAAPDREPTAATTTDAATTNRELVDSSPEEPVHEIPTSTTQFGSLSVTVSWSDGTAADGVSISVRDARADSVSNSFQVRTGAEGTVELHDLSAGPVTVFVDRAYQYRRESIVPGEITQLEITLPKGFSVHGRVVDAQGAPVAGADIYLDWNGTGLWGNVVAQTDASGSFRVRSIDGPLCWISARAEHFAPSAQRLTAGGPVDLDDVELVLRQPGTTLRGRVLNADGTGASGAQVLLGKERPNRVIRFEDGSQGFEPAVQLVRVDENGGFLALGVPLGELEVQALADSHAPWKGTVDTTRAGPFIDIRLTLGSSLAGHVSDSAGMPVARARVGGNGKFDFASRSARTKEDGSFLITGLPVGRFLATVEADGFEQREQEFLGDPAEPSKWEVELRKIERRATTPAASADDASKHTCTVRGRFVDRDRNPIAAARYSVYGQGQNSGRVYTADAEGRFEATGLPAGEFNLFAHANGFVHSTTGPINLAPSAEWDCGDIVLNRGGTIVAALQCNDPRLLSEVRIVAQGAKAGRSFALIPGQDEAEAVSEVLEPGEYRVELKGRPSSQVAWLTTSATIRESSASRISLSVEMGRGVVVAFSPSNVQEASVSFQDDNDTVLWTGRVRAGDRVFLSPRATRAVATSANGQVVVEDLADLLAGGNATITIQFDEH